MKTFKKLISKRERKKESKRAREQESKKESKKASKQPRQQDSKTARQQESKKARKQESKKARKQESKKARKQESKKARNFDFGRLEIRLALPGCKVFHFQQSEAVVLAAVFPGCKKGAAGPYPCVAVGWRSLHRWPRSV